MVDTSRENLRLQRFGAYDVDRETRQLRTQGRRIRLQEQPFQILCTLLDRAGSVVTREELHQSLWPGSVYVDFDHGLNNAMRRLREALKDDAAAPTYIETLPRIGYRFIYPLTTQPGGEASSAPTKTESMRRRATPWLAGALVVALTMGVWLGLRDRSKTMDPGADAEVASIAVVPFASLSQAQEDSFLADGLSEELMTHFSRIPRLRVAGVASSFRFKGGQDAAREIADALNVDHLLHGSVRRSGARVRITTHLIDSRTDRQLWSRTFETDLSDIFAIEDEIAHDVMSALQIRLIDVEAQQLARRGTHSAEAYRLYLMGMAQLRARGVQPDRDGARRQFEQATAIDPEFAGAHAGLASFYFNSVNSRNDALEESWRLGLAAAERAYALDPGNIDAVRVMGDFEMLRFRLRDESAAYGRAKSLFERAIEVEPSNSYAHFDFGRAIQWTEPRRAVELFDRAQELDPLVPVASGLSLLALDRLGMHEAAGKRLREFVASAGPSRSSRVVSAYESYSGKLDAAAMALINTSPQFALDIGSILLLAGIYRSFEDWPAAEKVLRGGGDDPLTDALRRAVVSSANGDHAAAFDQLDRRRAEYPSTRMLDLPAARMALLAGRYDRAAAILEERLPDLARGTEAISSTRVLPALDLVVAWSRTGRSEPARVLLSRVEQFLDGPDSPRLPLFTVQRARAHVLAGRLNQATTTLERAREEGFALTCHLDLSPQPLLYVDCIDDDPAFSPLRHDGSFQRWLTTIRNDNRAQRDRAMRSSHG